MIYTIKQTSQVEQVVITKVEYNFDGTIITVDVSHFAPTTSDEILILSIVLEWMTHKEYERRFRY